jgi:F-type H+-transporting ATPase subunit b
VFELDGFTFIFVIVNMLVLFFGLKYFLFKPVTKVMDERKAKAQSQLDSAAKAEREAESLKASYEEHLSRAKEEAQRIMDDSRKSAELEREKTIAETREEAGRILESAKASVSAERAKMQRELTNETSALAISLAGKILAENADTAHNRAVLDRVVGSGK